MADFIQRYELSSTLYNEAIPTDTVSALQQNLQGAVMYAKTLYMNLKKQELQKEMQVKLNEYDEHLTKWEKASKHQMELEFHQQTTVLVLGKKEGVFPRLRNLTRFGLGGKQGNGKQWVSWIHETDVVNMIEWIATHEKIEGVINCTAPNPIKNKEFMEIMRKGFCMPVGLPSPAWVLEAGAFVIRTETELILKSRWVLPRKILKI